MKSFIPTMCLLFCSFAANAQSSDITTCRNPSGKAFRHYSGAQEKDVAGWSDEQISNGVITLVRNPDGSFDILYVDVRNKPISVTQDGAKIVLLRMSDTDASFLAHYSGAATEIYTFFREKDGRNRYSVMNSRTGPNAFSPKSSLMVGGCDTIRFDLIR